MNKPLLWRFLALMFAVTLVAASCGGDDDGTDTGDDGETDTGDDDGTDTGDDDGTDTGDDGETDTGDDDGTDTGDDGETDTGEDSGDASDAEDVVDNTQMGSMLATVQERGKLICGVSGTATAFSETAADGSYTGFDVDFCRVVAAAVLGDAEAITFVRLDAAERFTAVQTGDVDLLMRNTTWTQSRDTDLGMDFGPTTYYDGQQLMARGAREADDIEGDGYSSESGVVDIDGATVCTNAGTTTEKNIKDASEAAEIEITLNTYADFDKVMTDFMNGSCDVVTTDGSALVGRKAKQQPDNEEWVIFPATPISKEPLGPVYGQNDSNFADAVNWAVYATFLADEKGITQDNVEEMRDNPPDAETGRLLGGEGELQTKMGLEADAFYQVILQVGNYNDIYERNLSPVGLSRTGSANANWMDGGLIYAPPRALNHPPLRTP